MAEENKNKTDIAVIEGKYQVPSDIKLEFVSNPNDTSSYIVKIHKVVRLTNTELSPTSFSFHFNINKEDEKDFFRKFNEELGKLK